MGWGTEQNHFFESPNTHSRMYEKGRPYSILGKGAPEEKSLWPPWKQLSIEQNIQGCHPDTSLPRYLTNPSSHPVHSPVHWLLHPPPPFSHLITHLSFYLGRKTDNMLCPMERWHSHSWEFASMNTHNLKTPSTSKGFIKLHLPLFPGGIPMLAAKKNNTKVSVVLMLHEALF